ncbi:MAG TPA: cupin-like domain-containing protein [Amoebophilaceae bacterium]|jgi:lysine-specific demethylase 8|nr:cupin-like domain-containing protein [Amoebophilaceae bacterium]
MLVHTTLAKIVVQEIPIASLPKSKTEFRDTYYKRRPVIFKGLAQSWEASEWDLGFFEKAYGTNMVSIQIKEELTGSLQGPVRTVCIHQSLKEYIQAIQQNGIQAGYLNQCNLLQVYPVLQRSLHFPAFYSSKLLTITNLWIGPQGTKSKLHYDSDHNLFAQLYGKKLVTLINPDQSEKCYPINRTWYDGYSNIDVLNPDLETYPLFNDVVLFQTVLKPGDVLYIPQGWWHDIRSLTPSISVNFWWITWSDFIKETLGEIWFGLTQKEQVDKRNSYLQQIKQKLFRNGK